MISDSRYRLRPILWCALLVTLILSACLPTPPGAPPETGVFTVDPVFREYYASIGGRDVLGPAITAQFYRGSDQCQYLQNALICLNAYANSGNRISLVSIGLEMGLPQPDDGQPVAIYEEFFELYKKINRLIPVGQPLSPARFNPNRNRIEQYFENLGFYRDIDAPYGDVRLLAYGVYGCGSDCTYTAPEITVAAPSPAAVEQPFLAQLVRLGGLTVFGVPLTAPYTTSNGSLEQVYENVVLLAPGGDTGDMRLLNTAKLLGLARDDPAPRPAEDDSQGVFYPSKNNLGFVVPLEFDHFIASHGGSEISGTPIEAAVTLADGSLRQCFENYCLTYDSRRSARDRVRLEPLGREYMLAYEIQPYETAPFMITPELVQVVVHAGSPRIAADQPQTFEMLVKYTDTQKPVSNVRATLTLTLPGGQQALYSLPPTDAQGRTSLTITPLQPAPENGRVISFQACLEGSNSEPVCAAQTYLIWNYQ